MINNKHKTQTFSHLTNTMMIFSALLALFFISGCSEQHEYRISLDSAEPAAIHDTVFLGDQAIGSVARIDQEGGSRFAIIHITDPAGINAMRVGIEREGHGAFRLSSMNIKPGAELLSRGTVIPTRAPILNAAEKGRVGLESVLQWVRGFWEGNPFMVIGVILVFIIALFALKRTLGRAAYLFIVAAVIFVVVKTARSEENRVGFTRDYLRQEQQGYQTRLNAASIDLDAGRHDLGAGSMASAERSLIIAVIQLDTCNLSMCGHEERVRALRASPLAYRRENQIRLLLDNSAELRSRQEQLLTGITNLQKLAGPPDVWKGLRTYQIKRTDLLLQFGAKPSSVGELIKDMRLLQGYPSALIVMRMITSENAAGWTRQNSGQWLSPAGVSFHDDGTPVLPAKETLPVPGTRIIVVTNTIKSIIEKQLPPPPPQTNIVIQTRYVTNFNQVTNTIFVAADSNRQPGASVASFGTNGNTPRQALTNRASIKHVSPAAAQPPAEKKGSFRLITECVTAGCFVFAAPFMIWLGYAAWLRGRPYTIQFELPEKSPGTSTDVGLLAIEEAILLGSSPLCTPCNLVANKPSIAVRPLGTWLSAGEGQVLLNDAVLAGTRRLRPGDRISITEGSAVHTYHFLGCMPLETGVPGVVATEND